MPYSGPDRALGATVRRLREEQGVTREALAFHAGLTNGTLARVELGKSSPTWETVVRVAGALGLSVSALTAAIETDEH